MWQLRYWIEYPSCHIGCQLLAVHRVVVLLRFRRLFRPREISIFFSTQIRPVIYVGKGEKRKPLRLVDAHQTDVGIRQSTTATFSRDNFFVILLKDIFHERRQKRVAVMGMDGLHEEADPLVDMAQDGRKSHANLIAAHRALLSAPERVG